MQKTLHHVGYLTKAQQLQGMSCALFYKACPVTRANMRCSMQAQQQLAGEWKVVYATNSGLISILGLSRLPGVAVGDITQSIDTTALTIKNKVCLALCS